MKISLAIFGLLGVLITNAQFTDVTSNYGFFLSGTSPQSGNGVSFYDYDNDGWDDLTIGQASNSILVYHNDNGDYTLSMTFPNTGDVKQLIWVDYDNDGDADFFFTVMNQSAKLYRNDGDQTFTDVTANLNLPISNGKSFGAAWGDYDVDGFADVYICNYSSAPSSHTNWLLHNNGDGTFTNVTNEMGVGDDYKPTYQCTWNDVNLDGLPDLYLVNDFSYGNQLYLNNGVSFDAVGDIYNLDLEMEGMSICWNDLDHDMDWDVFIADNQPGNKLMLNEGGVYTDIAASAGVQVFSTCWGSFWFDYDHDTWDDMHIATSLLSVNSNQNYLFHNNGDLTFTDVSMAGDAQIAFASAKGDKNNDGFWDFIVMKQYPATVALYQNDGGANHWIKVDLNGTVSNRDGIGAIIRHYMNGEQHMTGTYWGEGFMEQDSQYEILSLGENAIADSITITWPSGWVDRYYNLDADTVYTFTEGETYSPIITNVSNQMLCPSGGEIELSAENAESWLWNDNSEAQSLFVTEPGIYTCIIKHPSGVSQEASYEVTVYDPLLVSEVLVTPSCFAETDGCITLSFDGVVNAISWSNDSVGAEMCNLASGNYIASITDEHGCQQEHVIELSQPEELMGNIVVDSVCFGETAAPVLTIYGGTEPYDINWNGSNPDSVEVGLHAITITDDHLCTTNVDYEVAAYPVIQFNYLNDTVCFNETIALSYEVDAFGMSYDIDWNEEDPLALTAGDHIFEIVDEHTCSLLVNVHLDANPEIVLSTVIQDAEGGDNGSVEVMISGGLAPYSIEWDNGSFDNPLLNVGSGEYLATITDDADCSAQITAQVIDISVDENDFEITLYPNPVNDELRLQTTAGNNWSIFDMEGRLMKSGMTNSLYTTIDVRNFAAGSYFMVVNQRSAVFVKE
jgi:hypothetical protein